MLMIDVSLISLLSICFWRTGATLRVASKTRKQPVRDSGDYALLGRVCRIDDDSLRCFLVLD